jgi:hypothetical protein
MADKPRADAVHAVAATAAHAQRAAKPRHWSQTETGRTVVALGAAVLMMAIAAVASAWMAARRARTHCDTRVAELQCEHADALEQMDENAAAMIDRVVADYAVRLAEAEAGIRERVRKALGDPR